MYHTMLEYYLNLYDSGRREYAFQAETPAAYEEWKRGLRARLWEIAGVDRCLPCPPEHALLGVETIDGLTAETHTLQTEPGVVMPFYLLRPEAAKRGGHPVLIVLHGHGGGREVLGYQSRFIREALEDMIGG